MNANITPEQIKQSFTCNADLSDVNHLASEYFNWLSTLIHQATKEMDNNNPYLAKNLLNIAEFLADNCMNEFHQNATKADNVLAEIKGA